MSTGAAVKSPDNLTKFERKAVYKVNARGVYTRNKLWKPVVGTVRGKKVILGYYRTSNRYYELRDRNGRVTWSDEAGIEPSLLSPIDFVGPSLVVGLLRGLGITAGRTALRGGVSIVARRGISGRLASGLQKMKQAAARLVGKKTAEKATEKAVETVSGPLGSVSRAALEAAAKSSGSTVKVATRLTSKPQVGRALSVACGKNAEELAGAARAAGEIFTASIPKKLIVELEKIGLATLSKTRMGKIVGEEYRFLKAASEFIVRFFK